MSNSDTPAKVGSSEQLGLVERLRRGACAMDQNIDWPAMEEAAVAIESSRAAQDDAYVLGRNDEAQRWEHALRQTWQAIDPLRPAGQPGSYARGYDNGFAAALEVLRGNLKA